MSFCFFENVLRIFEVMTGFFYEFTTHLALFPVF